MNQHIGSNLDDFLDWEQGRREPSGGARTLLRIATKDPQAILEAA